jgi:PTS system glucose-specific IIC component
VVVDDDRRVSESALEAAGVHAVMSLPNKIWHLIVGPNAAQYAAEMAAHIG